MKKNKPYLLDTIDLVDIIKKLWHEKILILLISLTFMVSGYVYGALQPTIYKTKIVVRDLPEFLFVEYAPISENHRTLFNYEFKLNILSLTTLIQFVEQYSEINDFRSNLRNQNIDFKRYFDGKIKSELDNRKLISTYSFTFQKPLQGDKFLNDYIKFVEKKTQIEFTRQMSHLISNNIQISEKKLKIAEIINSKISEIINSKDYSQTVVDQAFSKIDVFQDKEVLSQQITFLKEFLKKNQQIDLSYSSIIDEASIPTIISTSPKIFVASAFALGFFLSLIIIFTKSAVQNKDKQ